MLIPEFQYYDLTRWGRGYSDMSARALYPDAERETLARSWNARPSSEIDKGELWEKFRLRQLADDRAAFARHFRSGWDLRSIVGAKALRDIQAFVRDWLRLAHWKLPTDNIGVQNLLMDAVASGRLVPVVNRRYRAAPRVMQPDPAPQYWPAIGGGGYSYPAGVLTSAKFFALKRANGELPALDSFASGVAGATLDPLPSRGAPASADNGFDLLGAVNSAAGIFLGGRDDDLDDHTDVAELLDGEENDDSDDVPTPLGDAEAFEYGDSSPTDEVTALAARGVSEEHEAECAALYDRDMDECNFARAIYQDPRTYALCAERAFSNYQTCRGY
ncbi:hypothetical protein [Caballeronia sp. SL2Y3]|uniref:hypothetical protein n=1 Tax=Caballeronia sp. SL2Y3 TaxID=2878151 RepID=UPI001FD52CFD|nr:hypothetical protein [Caballeronia sp. SL2Y3]